MRQGAGERPPKAPKEAGSTRPRQPGRLGPGALPRRRPGRHPASRFVLPKSPKRRAHADPGSLAPLGAGARRDTRHQPALSVPSRTPGRPRSRRSARLHQRRPARSRQSRGHSPPGTALPGRPHFRQPNVRRSPQPNSPARLGFTVRHQTRDRPASHVMRRTFRADRRSGRTDRRRARASSHDCITAQGSAPVWRRPVRPTHTDHPRTEDTMKLVLREENTQGSPAFFVEQHRAEHPVIERFPLEIYSARIAVRCDREGFVSHPTRPPGAQQWRRYLRGLAVRTTPLFGDGRALPAWPKRETSDGVSARLEIDCPDDTEVEVSLSRALGLPGLRAAVKAPRPLQNNSVPVPISPLRATGERRPDPARLADLRRADRPAPCGIPDHRYHHPHPHDHRPRGRTARRARRHGRRRLRSRIRRRRQERGVRRRGLDRDRHRGRSQRLRLPCPRRQRR